MEDQIDFETKQLRKYQQMIRYKSKPMQGSQLRSMGAGGTSHWKFGSMPKGANAGWSGLDRYNRSPN